MSEDDSQPEVVFWRPLIEQFEAKNPNIHIELANDLGSKHPVHPTNSDELRDVYISAFEGKDKAPLIDLINMDIIWVAEFASKGWLMDLSEEFSKTELEEEFLRSEVDTGFYKDKLYRIPFRTDIGVLYYRKDLLKKAGKNPPKTFEELKDIARELKDQGKPRSGYVWQGKDYEGLVAMFVEVLHGHGGFWIRESKEGNIEVGLGQEKAIAAVEFLFETIELGISPPDPTNYDEGQARGQFREDKAIFMRNWPNIWTDANGPDSEIRGNVGIIPMVHADGATSGACKGGWGFGIAAKSTRQRQKAAVKTIKFFTSAATQRQYALSYGAAPSRRKLFLDPEIVARSSHFPELLNWIDASEKKDDSNDDRKKWVDWILRPPIPEYAEASQVLNEHLRKALKLDKDRYSPFLAMKEAAEKTCQIWWAKNLDCKVVEDEPT